MLGRFLKYWLPLMVWMAVIFEASTGLGTTQHSSRIVEPILRWLMPNISQESMDFIHYYVRKTAHFTEYAILGILIWRVVRSNPKYFAGRSVARQFCLVLLLAALYAASDEFHQSFNPMREARVMDVFIDTCGAGGGALVFLAWNRWRKVF